MMKYKRGRWYTIATSEKREDVQEEKDGTTGSGATA
jgi:hypothetical protein